MSEIKVLIIEDSPSQAAIIADIVRQGGYVPAVYSDLQSGIAQILLRERPTLVLLDLKLVDERGKQVADGFQLCREIKRHKIPVIVVSAQGDEQSTEWAMLQGADAFLKKPFAVDDLQQVMSIVLSARRTS